MLSVECQILTRDSKKLLKNKWNHMLQGFKKQRMERLALELPLLDSRPRQV